jgi:hypothetical protein
MHPCLNNAVAIILQKIKKGIPQLTGIHDIMELVFGYTVKKSYTIR